jgi:DNA-binding NarL/FixJ family response regulator
MDVAEEILSARSSHQELIEESQRLRQEFDHNVIKLRVTLERTKAVTAADWVWLNGSKVSITPENSAAETHLLDSLTRREVEVLRLIAEGKSSKEVAKELGMAFRTAVCHRYRIFQKLKVHETASVVRLAVRAGLIHA